MEQGCVSTVINAMQAFNNCLGEVKNDLSKLDLDLLALKLAELNDSLSK